MDRDEYEALFDSKEWREYRDHILNELIPKLEESAVIASLIPEGEPDVKFAVELGFSIMLDKPIIAVVKPGVKVPEKLVLVADHIVEVDFNTEQGQERLADTLNRIMDEMADKE